MILYDSNDLKFIFRVEGSVIPKSILYTVPSMLLTVLASFIIHEWQDHFEVLKSSNQSVIWSAFIIVLSVLLTIRTNKAYDRFWEGITLVQQMRAEWFETTSNLTAFSMVAAKKDAKKLHDVLDFQYVLVRLMSLMHGAALCQIGGHGHDFDVLDLQAIDENSFRYLDECEQYDVNRVEVILHWIQVLVTDAASNDVIIVPAPILTRCYQTLSRGMVNLHNARKLADVPFPFPLSQILIVLQLIFCCVTPLFVSTVVEHPGYAAFICFVPIFGMWGITFVAGELEQPFGSDPNDLPLTALQYDFNTTLLMLLDKQVHVAPSISRSKALPVNALRMALVSGSDPNSRTDSKYVGKPLRSSYFSAYSSIEGSIPSGESMRRDTRGAPVSVNKRITQHIRSRHTHNSALERRKAKMKCTAQQNGTTVSDESTPDLNAESSSHWNYAGSQAAVSINGSEASEALAEIFASSDGATKTRRSLFSSASVAEPLSPLASQSSSAFSSARERAVKIQRVSVDLASEDCTDGKAANLPQTGSHSMLEDLMDSVVKTSHSTCAQAHFVGDAYDKRRSLSLSRGSRRPMLTISEDFEDASHSSDAQRWNALLAVSMQTSEAVGQLVHHLKVSHRLEIEGNALATSGKPKSRYCKPRSPRMPSPSKPPPMESPRS